MPGPKPKPSEVAVEAKRTYIPYIEKRYPDLLAKSFAYSDVDHLTSSGDKNKLSKKLRVAVIDGDSVDIALKWNQEESRTKAQDMKRRVCSNELRIPLVLPVDEKRAGGDWESGSMAPEENLSRRSNLVHCLSRHRAVSSDSAAYPIPSKGGLYSPHVVVFRSGPQAGYKVWSEFAWLPVISVAPGRRPKLTSSGEDYSFEQERELMREKMRIVLRMAAAWRHRDLCIGPFGTGLGFRNPSKQLASMWKEILFTEDEFQNAFENIVFAIENNVPGSNGSSSCSDFDIFKKEFDPSNVCKTSYRGN